MRFFTNYKVIIISSIHKLIAWAYHCANSFSLPSITYTKQRYHDNRGALFTCRCCWFSATQGEDSVSPFACQPPPPIWLSGVAGGVLFWSSHPVEGQKWNVGDWIPPHPGMGWPSVYALALAMRHTSPPPATSGNRSGGSSWGGSTTTACPLSRPFVILCPDLSFRVFAHLYNVLFHVISSYVCVHVLYSHPPCPYHHTLSSHHHPPSLLYVYHHAHLSSYVMYKNNTTIKQNQTMSSAIGIPLVLFGTCRLLIQSTHFVDLSWISQSNLL